MDLYKDRFKNLKEEWNMFFNKDLVLASIKAVGGGSCYCTVSRQRSRGEFKSRRSEGVSSICGASREYVGAHEYQNTEAFCGFRRTLV